MGNIFRGFKKQLGYANITNQYLEMMVRTWATEHGGLALKDASSKVGLKVEELPEDLSVRISRQYIVNIHSCVEEFLLRFKELPGSPTYDKKYDAQNDKSRLKWTVKWCFTKDIDGQINDLVNICEYYRLIRNRIVHGKDRAFGEIKTLKNSIKLTSEELKTKVYGNLQALNDFEEICFDDQVLFSRSAICLAEKIYKESQYDWSVVLSENNEKIKEITSHVNDNKEKQKKKIIKYLSENYYILNEELLYKELMD